MSTENITKFSEAVASDATLGAKIQAIQATAARDTAEKIAALSVEAGTPFTADKFLVNAASVSAELSDEDLEAVSGGAWKPSAANLAVSLFTAGIACAVFAAASAIIGKAHNTEVNCEPVK